MRKEITMPTIRIQSLPRILFAHSFHADTYSNTLTGQAHHMEITCIGTGALHVSRDGQAFTAHSGDIVCNLYDRPMVVHSDGFHEHHTVCFSFDFDMPGESATPDGEPEAFPRLCLPLMTTPNRQTGDRLRDCILEIIRLHTLSPDDPDALLRCTGLFLQLLADISACARTSDRRDAYSHERYTRRAKDYIFGHLDAPIRQQEIAAYLGISSEYLCTVFRHCEGVTVMTYINRVKLERIRTVMLKEHLPLHKAAEMYGFNDPNYVSRLYRKMYGTSLTASLQNQKQLSDLS